MSTYFTIQRVNGFLFLLYFLFVFLLLEKSLLSLFQDTGKQVQSVLKPQALSPIELQALVRQKFSRYWYSNHFTFLAVSHSKQ